MSGRGPGEAGCTVRLASASPDGTSAIACIELQCCGEAAAAASRLDEIVQAIGISSLVTGQTRVVNIGDIDRAFVVRWSGESVTIMPHAGPVIVAQVMEFVLKRGAPFGLIQASEPGRPLADESSASGAALCDRHLHEALAMAASPGAIDLLLNQPSRWAAYSGNWRDAQVLACSRVLSGLLREPTIAVVGPPNVGKSSLLNALAGRSAAIVADEAGTTRDHVGVSLVLGHPCGGLAVRWLDTPGVTPEGTGNGDGLTELSWRAVLPLVRAADLVVLCGDAERPPPELAALGVIPAGSVVRLSLRADAGLSQWRHDLAVGGLGVPHIAPKASGGVGATSFGLSELIERLGRELLPLKSLDSEVPWAFWVC